MYFEKAVIQMGYIFIIAFFIWKNNISEFAVIFNCSVNIKGIYIFPIYCEEFQDIIVGSWLKFASEDLTDEILDLFEKGADEQKIYLRTLKYK